MYYSSAMTDWPGCPSVRPSVCYPTCEQDMLNMNKPVSMQIGTSCPRYKMITFVGQEVKGQRLYEAEGTFESLKEASVSTFLGRVVRVAMVA